MQNDSDGFIRKSVAWGCGDPWRVAGAAAISLTAVALVVAVIVASNRPIAPEQQIITAVPATPERSAVVLSPPDPAGASLIEDFSTGPDGRGLVESNVLDTGRNATPLGVTSGTLTHGAPIAPRAASYLSKRTDEPVRRIGATVRFPEGASGNVSLIAWQEPLSSYFAPPQFKQFPNAGLHFVVSRSDWHLGVWDSAAGKEYVLMSGYFSSRADTALSWEVRRAGSVATVINPDGLSRTVQDARIGGWTGAHPSWQLFEFDESRKPAMLTRLWAE